MPEPYSNELRRKSFAVYDSGNGSLEEVAAQFSSQYQLGEEAGDTSKQGWADRDSPMAAWEKSGHDRHPRRHR
jgi:hypothetical protein